MRKQIPLLTTLLTEVNSKTISNVSQYIGIEYNNFMNGHTLKGLKKLGLVCFLLIGVVITTEAQRNIGAGNGVDGDLYSNTQTYGDTTRSGFDDWFYGGTDTGQGTIDTVGASALLTLMQTTNNISFQRSSAYNLWEVVNGRVNIIAGYARDNIGGFTSDSTTFSNGAKNGDDFRTLSRGSGTAISGPNPSKSDLMDVWTAFKRDGLDVDDTLWLLGAVATLGTNGDKHFDFEYNQSLTTFDLATGAFLNCGLDAGHTAWTFDNNSNGVPTKVGDVILSCEWKNSGLNDASLKLWVHDTTFNANTAQGSFTWGTTFYGPTGGFGYADVVVPSGVIVEHNNTSTTPISASPWGAKDKNGDYVATYSQYQFLDFGINLTEIGVDPSILLLVDSVTGVPDPCTPLYYSFMAKSRTSNSFTSALVDFTSPITFNVPELNDLVTIGDTTLNCKTGDTLEITASSAAASLYSSPLYRWITTDGNIVGATNTGASGDTIYTANAKIYGAGTYSMSLSKYVGCAGEGLDTIVILNDTTTPVATAFRTIDSLTVANNNTVTIVGGDSAASIAATSVTWPTLGITWDWTGPNGFTSTNKDITIGDSGTYTLVATEERNGCTDTAQSLILILPVDWLDIGADIMGNKVLVSWTTAQEINNDFFSVQRLNQLTNKWENIGAVKSKGYSVSITNYSFEDNEPKKAVNFYRIKQTDYNGKTDYSPSAFVEFNKKIANPVILTPNPSNGLININTSGETNGEITVIDQLGKTIGTYNSIDENGSFDLSNLTAGYYYIQVKVNQSIEYIKLSIK